MSEILTSPIFWIFGGGIVLAFAAIFIDYVAKIQKMRAQERQQIREHEAEMNRHLLGTPESDESRGLKLRIEALELEMAELRKHVGLGPVRTLHVVRPPEAGTGEEQPTITA